MLYGLYRQKSFKFQHVHDVFFGILVLYKLHLIVLQNIMISGNGDLHITIAWYTAISIKVVPEPEQNGKRSNTSAKGLLEIV
jgi:hypothetical protein